ncbi:kinetochore protein NDC80 homolog isoform X2 [Ambystoma mexicanum]|uniref:kinetochore protein NDC80 homolog isoform X2 n=1 Tax=Ambystoma mexicanum TaxID=8296 RepID=UPI0037E93C9A
MSRSSSSNGRQSLLPLRVQDTNRPGLTTPQNKERPGFGKLSSTRPSSSKSERSSNLFGKRSSSGTRNSQYGAFGGPEKIKEPRPINDKAYIQQCIRQLCEFLLENGFSQNISVKSLQAPSSKDFVRIFAFIYNCLAPGYEAPLTKFEEEIPRIFKDLGYPFPLSKSSMYSVGAPHTWPHIVAALIWLTECVKLRIHQKEAQLSYGSWEEETEDGIEHNQIFLEFTTKCYSLFMQGGDSFDEISNETCSKLKDHYKVSESHLEGLYEENRRLIEELERLEREKDSEPDRLAAMKKQKTSLEKDIHTYENYLTELRCRLSNLEQKLECITQDVEAAVLEYEALSMEDIRLKNILDNQKYSVADIERIKYEQNELQQTINKHTKELDEDRKHLWNEELRYAKIRENIEAHLIEYHKMARKLKLIPSTAENANGQDFQISFNPDSNETSLTQYRTSINAPLMQLLSHIEGETATANNRKISLEDMLEQVNTMVAEKRHDVKLLTEEFQKLDEMYQQKVEEFEEEQKKSALEMESLEKHRQILESGLSKGIEEAQQTLQEAQQQNMWMIIMLKLQNSLKRPKKKIC